MRRLAAVLVTVTLSLLAGAVPATAGEGPLLHGTTVPFAGTSVFDFDTAACSFVHQTFDATFLWAPGRPGSFSVDGCADFLGGQGFDYTGTVVVTTPGGGVFSGAVTGVVQSGDPPPPCEVGTAVAFELTFALEPGHTVDLRGTWCSPEVPGVPGDISGLLS